MPRGMRPPIGGKSHRVFQEVDDFLNLVLRLVHAGDVLERDGHGLRIDGAGFLERRHATRHHAIQRQAGEPEEEQAQRQRAKAADARRLDAIDVHCDAAVGKRRKRTSDCAATYPCGAMLSKRLPSRCSKVSVSASMTTCLIDPAAAALRKSENGAGVGCSRFVPLERSSDNERRATTMNTPVPIQNSRLRGTACEHQTPRARTKGPALPRLCPPTFGGARKKRKTARNCQEERQGCGG